MLLSYHTKIKKLEEQMQKLKKVEEDIEKLKTLVKKTQDRLNKSTNVDKKGIKNEIK